MEAPYRLSIVGYTVFEWEGVPVQDLKVMQGQYMQSRNIGEPEWPITLLGTKHHSKLEQQIQENPDVPKPIRRSQDAPRFRGDEAIRPNFDLKDLAKR